MHSASSVKQASDQSRGLGILRLSSQCVRRALRPDVKRVPAHNARRTCREAGSSVVLAWTTAWLTDRHTSSTRLILLRASRSRLPDGPAGSQGACAGAAAAGAPRSTRDQLGPAQERRTVFTRV